jgi:hypothetical protein
VQPCVFKVPLVFLAHTDQYQIGLPQKLLELDLQVPLSCHFRSRLRWGFDQAHAVFKFVSAGRNEEVMADCRGIAQWRRLLGHCERARVRVSGR